jgi:hypothetical protein
MTVKSMKIGTTIFLERPNAERSAEQICQTVLRALENFTEDTPPSDDITLLVVKRQRKIADRKKALASF